jgi:hypothetical protein
MDVTMANPGGSQPFNVSNVLQLLSTKIPCKLSRAMDAAAIQRRFTPTA